MKSNKITSGVICALSIILGVLICDQIIKVWIKTTMRLHDSIHIADWFYLYFTENKGMAFGWNFIGTLFLASFRVIAVALMSYFLIKTIRRKYPLGFIACLSLVVAGASGNIFDNAFYGLIFTESTPFRISSLVPWGGGYSGFLMGHVVDMFYFPIIDTDWPDWFPLVGGEHFIFFSPIFNFADAAISCGGVALALFYRRYLVSFKEFDKKRN